MHAHIELLARDLRQDGLSPDEARAAARRQVGNVTRALEESRDAWGFPAIDAIVQDVRYALRGLRRAPGFTITVILTLGLGIGANVAIFAVLDRLMFRPFPLLHDPATVGRVYLRTTYRGRSNANSTFPYLRFVDLSAATRTISDIAAQTEWRNAVFDGQRRVMQIVLPGDRGEIIMTVTISGYTLTMETNEAVSFAGEAVVNEVPQFLTAA